MSWDWERKSKLDMSLRSHLISSMISWWQWYQLHPSALLPANLIGEICCFDCHLTSHLTSTPPLSPHNTHSQRPWRFSPPTRAHAIKCRMTSAFLERYQTRPTIHSSPVRPFRVATKFNLMWMKTNLWRTAMHATGVHCSVKGTLKIRQTFCGQKLWWICVVKIKHDLPLKGGFHYI